MEIVKIDNISNYSSQWITNVIIKKKIIIIN